MKLLILLLLFAGVLQADTITVRNEGPMPIDAVYIYTPTTFQNQLQWAIPPGEERMVVPNYAHGTFGVFIASGSLTYDWIDIQFRGGDHLFVFRPPWHEHRIEYHSNYNNACTTEAEARSAGGFVMAGSTIMTLIALWLTTRRKR